MQRYCLAKHVYERRRSASSRPQLLPIHRQCNCRAKTRTDLVVRGQSHVVLAKQRSGAHQGVKTAPAADPNSATQTLTDCVLLWAFASAAISPHVRCEGDCEYCHGSWNRKSPLASNVYRVMPVRRWCMLILCPPPQTVVEKGNCMQFSVSCSQSTANPTHLLTHFHVRNVIHSVTNEFGRRYEHGATTS